MLWHCLLAPRKEYMFAACTSDVKYLFVLAVHFEFTIITLTDQIVAPDLSLESVYFSVCPLNSGLSIQSTLLIFRAELWHPCRMKVTLMKYLLHGWYQRIAEISVDALLIRLRLDLYSGCGCANISVVMGVGTCMYVYDCIYILP
jgi:hypothetical protein